MNFPSRSVVNLSLVVSTLAGSACAEKPTSTPSSMARPIASVSPSADTENVTYYNKFGKPTTLVQIDARKFNEDIHAITSAAISNTCEIKTFQVIGKEICLPTLEFSAEEKKSLQNEIRNVGVALSAGYQSATTEYLAAGADFVKAREVESRREKVMVGTVMPFIQKVCAMLAPRNATINELQTTINKSSLLPSELLKVFEVLAFNLDYNLPMEKWSLNKVENKLNLVPLFTETKERFSMPLTNVVEHYQNIIGDKEIFQQNTVSPIVIRTTLPSFITYQGQEDPLQYSKLKQVGAHVSTDYKGRIFLDDKYLAALEASGFNRKEIEEAILNHEGGHSYTAEQLDRRMDGYIYTPIEQLERYSIDELLACTTTIMSKDKDILIFFLTSFITTTEPTYQYVRELLAVPVNNLIKQKMQDSGMITVPANFDEWTAKTPFIQRLAAYKQVLAREELEQIVRKAAVEGKNKLRIFLTRISKKVAIHKVVSKLENDGYVVSVTNKESLESSY